VSHPSDVKQISTFRLENPHWRVLVLLSVISSLVFGLNLVSARSSFDPVMYKQLKFEDRVGCHMNARGGAPWNPFGLAVGKFRAKRLPIDKAVFEALKLEADVDKDGFTDALEVFAGTMPGDAISRPVETLEVLKSKFDAAGGVTQYAPR
jgi:hypothetical protein